MYQELQVLYFTTNLIMLVILRMGWEGNVAHVGEIRGAYGLLVWKPEANREEIKK